MDGCGATIGGCERSCFISTVRYGLFLQLHTVPVGQCCNPLLPSSRCVRQKSVKQRIEPPRVLELSPVTAPVENQ